MAREASIPEVAVASTQPALILFSVQSPAKTRLSKPELLGARRL